MDLMLLRKWNSAPLALVAFLLLIPVHTALAQIPGVSPIGNGRQYGCWETSQGNLLLQFKRSGMISNVSFEQGRTQVERQIRRTSNKIRQARTSPTRANRARLAKKLKRLQRILEGISQCESNGTTPPTTGDSTNACSVATTQQRALTSSRIINGEYCSARRSNTVKIHMYGSGNAYLGSCSGTAVSKRLIVSAAHCIQSGVSAVEVIVDKSSFRTSTFRAHSGFNQYISPLEQNDIAVILVHSDLPVTPAPILRSLGDEQIGKTAVIAGYGLTESNSAGKLKAATVKIQKITRHSITIRYTGLGTHGNTCFGDSGGPIFLAVSGRWYLAGVTSNGIRQDCGAGDISNFTNITHRSNADFIEAWMRY